MKSRSGSWVSVLILISGVVFLLPFTVYSQTPINCGEAVSGSISPAGEQDQYTFDGAANDGITIRVRKTSGTLIAFLELYGPGGSLITSAAGQINRTLTESGTHRIVVRDQNNTNTGDYALLWQRMNNPCNATTVDCGQVATGSIGTGLTPPPWKFHTFTVSANDAVTIRVANTSGGSFSPYMEIYSPSGVYITAGTVLDSVLSAGTYTILVRDASNLYSGNYVFTWQSVQNPCNAIPVDCGQVVSGTINGAGQMIAYTFTASASDAVTVRIRKTSGDVSPNIELYNPSGTRIGGPHSSKINAALTAAGQYTILVRDGTYLNTGNYLLVWQKVKGPCNAVAIECGQVVTGSVGTSVDPPPWRFHTVTVSANDAVTIRVANTSGGSFSPYMEVYDPNGTYILAGTEFNNVLAGGTYTILVRDASDAYSGNYALTWQKVKNPCNTIPADCGQVVSGTINCAGK